MNLGKKRKKKEKKKETERKKEATEPPGAEGEAKGVSAAGPGRVPRGLRGRLWPMPISGTKSPGSGLAEHVPGVQGSEAG